MDVYELTQALMAVESVYHVRRPRTEEVLYTVRGELMSTTAKFTLTSATDGARLADLGANFLKTRYEIREKDAVLATIVFPPVAFKKTFTLTTSDTTYAVDGGVFRGVFVCKDPSGEVDLEIAKEMSIRDTFMVKTSGKLPLPVGLLAAVAIHSRFYEIV